MYKKSLMALWLGLGLTACNQYDLKVNERIVYAPRPLFEDFAAADPALQACLEQAVAENKVTSAARLHKLACAGEGVESLSGLEVFTGLRRLRLDDNRISSLAPLVPLSSLESLEIANNQVVDPLPLYDLLSLRILDLRGNSGLSCPRPQDLLRVVELNLPGHCVEQ